MPNPTAAMLVIGDEILSGRTVDANTNYLATRLNEIGVALMEARVVADDHHAIVAAVRALSGAWDVLFTSGGIGPTHDDITADAVAAAFETPIDIRADARAILEARYAKSEFEINEARLRMARIPDGAALIDNPVSGAPGFTIQNTHVCAGVPKIFQAMVEGVLPSLKGGAPLTSKSIRMERPEGEIAGPLGGIAAAFPEVSIGSYPFVEKGVLGTNIVIRGTDAEKVDAVAVAIRREFPE